VNGNVLRIHAIILALNEEIFIRAQLDTIYPFCSGISIITQYDRDWYGKAVMPDKTVEIVLNYPDPNGKIQLVARRMPDEAAARNMEMLSFNQKAFGKVMSHGASLDTIKYFHNPPDYFWIIDADEIYDVQTIPAILEYLLCARPRGLRITGYNYLRTWNRRVPRSAVDFTHFGFIKPGILFEQRRVVSWNESRLAKGFSILRLPDWSAKIFGFETCPESVGVFHHGCWLGDNARIQAKFSKSSHRESSAWSADSVDAIPSLFIETSRLPTNIRQAIWPLNFFDELP
jgi:hypothetical protein